MRTIELKSAVAIVHKQQFIPQRCLMTLFTTHLLPFAELAAMRVVMAIAAARSQRPVANEFCDRICRFYWIHRRAR